MGNTVSRKSYLFTSESVSEGHPDKVCDRISDEVVDLFFREGPKAGIDPWQLQGRLRDAGDHQSGHNRGRDARAQDHHPGSGRARGAHGHQGHRLRAGGLPLGQADIRVLLHPQSADIAQGVDSGGNRDEGAGDQGIMFGFACKDTPELMPAPIYYSHKILRLISEARHAGKEAVLGPDSKSQVTVRYENGKPVAATQIVVSHQHLVESMTSAQVRELVEPYVRKALPNGWISKDTVWHVNPTGKFHIGGPDGDSGLTGRKIIVDTYGGAAPHGGGAFSGKDPTKVDRSAAYAARYLAKNVVAAGLADECTIQLSYAIGVAKPLSIYVDVGRNPSDIDTPKLERVLGELVDLSPRGIRKHLDLNKPIYARTSAYGHFGREPDNEGGFSWEKTDLGPKIKAAMA